MKYVIDPSKGLVLGRRSGSATGQHFWGWLGWASCLRSPKRGRWLDGGVNPSATLKGCFPAHSDNPAAILVSLWAEESCQAVQKALTQAVLLFPNVGRKGRIGWIRWTDKSQFKSIWSKRWVDCRGPREKRVPKVFRAETLWFNNDLESVMLSWTGKQIQNRRVFWEKNGYNSSLPFHVGTLYLSHSRALIFTTQRSLKLLPVTKDTSVILCVTANVATAMKCMQSYILIWEYFQCKESLIIR